MLIVIEGPNGAGKTTLATALALHATQYAPGADAMIVHAAPPDPADRNPVDEYETQLLGMLPENTADALILDRWCLGELVYGPIYRGVSRLTEGALLHCEMVLETHGAVKVCLLPPQRVLCERWERKNDELSDKEDLLHERGLFGRLAHAFKYVILSHSVEALETQTLVKNGAHVATEAARIAGSIPGYLGRPFPDVVFAGDQRSGDASDLTYPYPFTPAGPGCSGFLWDALAPYSETVLSRTGWLNANEPGMDIARAHEALGRPRWVAVGREAAMRLQDAPEIRNFTLAYHPQYMSRFQHGSQAQYGLSLMQAGGFL
jgi:hypothetical protein